MSGRRQRRPIARVAVALALGVTSSVHPQGQLQVGYTVLVIDPGNPTPVATALFQYATVGPSGEHVIVSQAGVGAAVPIASGRIFVDQSATETGIALVNPGTQSASLTLTLRDGAGREVERRSQTLAAGQHLPRYVGQLFPSLPAGFVGTMTFESSQKVAAITLRESKNTRGEALYSTLPVVDLAAPARSSPLLFPHVAAGDGYTTQIVLINTAAQRATGTIRFTDSSGGALAVRLGGATAPQFPYQVEGHGTVLLECDRPAGLGVGYATVTPDAGSVLPAGTAIFQFRASGAIVTEAGVAASTATTSARIFADSMATYTGVALANTAGQSVATSFTLLDRYGDVVDSTTRTLPPRGHLAVFAHELFPGSAEAASGVIDIASSTPIAAITLRQTDNSRGDQVLTTLPVADLTRPSAETTLVFPQVAIGEGFSTRLIVINTSPTARSAGILRFHESSGAAMTVPLGGKSDSRFPYDITAGGGRQYLPGNTAPLASLALLDPASDLVTREVVVNEGKTLRPKLRVLDTDGLPRDDFDLQFASLSTDVATVDATGNIQGKKAGFSTLTVSGGGIIGTGVITVVAVSAGATGFQITGVAQDLARRVYLADSANHTILLSESVRATPSVYAGVSRSPGLRNEARLQSLFRRPGLLELNQADGTLYVADSDNHAIRRVQPGPSGRVATLAGTGSAGSADGSGTTASFRNPQGIALDGRGNLWVADTDNHTIRRIRLATGVVETIAGRAGSSGWVDATGAGARFSSPAGIALENEPAARQLERERQRLPPPPVSLIVADRGNGAIRRIKETGEVETIREAASTAPAGSARAPGPRPAAGAPVIFASPTGVAVDPFGTIYVSEPASARVRAILPGGDVVAAAQPRTLTFPGGIVASGGRILVADGGSTAQEIAYGEPSITSVTPDRFSNRGGTLVTVRGSNFAPETVVVVGGAPVTSAIVRDTQSLTFTAPAASSGTTNLTVQNRAGIAQRAVTVAPVPLSQLAAGNITTVAGGSTYAGDGAAATQASLPSLGRLAFDSAGNLYVADPVQNRVRRVSAATGIITTIAGTGSELGGYSGDGGLALAANLNHPWGVAVDASGTVYIADTDNNCIRKVAAATGLITTVAGTGDFIIGELGDGGPAIAATLHLPTSVAVDAAGDLYVSDFWINRVRKVAVATGIITTVAGSGEGGNSGDGGPATAATIDQPSGLAVDATGNLYIALWDRVRKVATATGIITTVAGSGNLFGPLGDGGPATAATLSHVGSIVVDAAGNLYLADSSTNRVRKVAAATGTITTVAGNGLEGFSGDGGAATAASLNYPNGLAVDGAGNLAIADAENRRIRRVAATTGIITTSVGNGQPGTFGGDGGPAAEALLSSPGGIGHSQTGDFLIADFGNGRVRKIAASTGIITTVAGNGQFSSAGDGGLATAAAIAPSDVVFDSSGNLFIADPPNHRVRKIAAATGIITTVAGTGTAGFSGDGRPATSARLDGPEFLAVDTAGNLYIADFGNDRVRKVAAATGIITTVAGTGTGGFSGDGGPATSAQINGPEGLAVDITGNLFIADSYNDRIRKVAAATGIITTVAGTGTPGFSGDGGPATSAHLSEPVGIAVDSLGNIFICDSDNHRVRKVAASTGIITTVAGNAQFREDPGDNGPATSALLAIPVSVAVDTSGNLYISDLLASRIRVVRGPL